jgi:methylmalonyl-CoA/ethylmalonyl-CoA epimerase
MRKIEHIGIAVHDIEASNKVFTKIFGKESYKSESVESESVVTSFFQVGESKIELVAATNQDSPIAKYLAKNRAGIHHIAFDVEDINAEMKRLQSVGIRTLTDQPKQGADNKLICFLHPNDTNGLLIELCQEIER